MKKLFMILFLCVVVMTTCTSCVTTAVAYDDVYSRSDCRDDNVVVVDNVCYVYYENPTTAFLNTLYLIDGAYYYWYLDRYIPVVFPYWYAWSPHRFFYYHNNRWLWRDKIHYNHADYRRTHQWKDYRKPSSTGARRYGSPNSNNRQRGVSGSKTRNMRSTIRGNGTQRRFSRSNNTRSTIHMNMGSGGRTNHGGRR